MESLLRIRPLSANTPLMMERTNEQCIDQLNGITISVIIPAYNEEESLKILLPEIARILRAHDETTDHFEILVINDGSTDNTNRIIDNLKNTIPELRTLKFTNNQGKTKALERGFTLAQGMIIITMDADLQDDPADIPRFLETLQQGFDMVCGWRKERTDTRTKRMVSHIANRITTTMTGLSIHDMNCGFKAYRREVIDKIALRSDFHRFIHIIAQRQGYEITEIPVHHHPRTFGTSKYGSVRASRLIKSGFDFVALLFLLKFSEKPLHLFGTLAIITMGGGGIVLVYLSILKFAYAQAIGTRPLFYIGVFFVTTGVQFLGMGFLGEIIRDTKK